MDSFLPFFIVLFASVSFAFLSKKIHLPWVVALILSGVIIGPHGFNILPENETVSFIGEAGLVFLMFMAGVETKLGTIRSFGKEIIPVSIINALVPFAVGFFLGQYFGYSVSVSILIGIVFVSSAIAVVIPMLQSHQLLQKRLGQELLAINIIQDVVSLILLSALLQTERRLANVPLYIFYPILIASLFALRYLLPRIQEIITDEERHDVFQREVRSILFFLIGTVIVFELLGLHSIIAGFFTGFVFSDYISSHELKTKLNAISYGVFIPTFFVVVGARIDVGVLTSLNQNALFIVAVIVSSIIAKFLSGFVASMFVGFTKQQALLVGASTTSKLSTTLAATFSAAAIGLIDSTITTSMIVLCIFTTIIGPMLMGMCMKNVVPETDLKRSG